MGHSVSPRLMRISASQIGRRGSTTFLAIAGVIGLGLAGSPAQAGDYGASTFRATTHDYKNCGADILATDVSAEQAAAACAAALRPKELSRCVVDITKKTSIKGVSALSSCSQVRRPRELATCVVELNQLGSPDATDVMDNCRRSLLPKRYAACVTGLSRSTSLPAAKAMTTCLDGDGTPSDIAPTPLVPSAGFTEPGGTPPPTPFLPVSP